MKLSLHEQFCYVKPILKLILDDAYEPAKARHEAFVKGGQKRLAICEMAGATGDLTAKTVEELSQHLTRWVLRDEALADGELVQLVMSEGQKDMNLELDAPSLPVVMESEKVADNDLKSVGGHFDGMLTPDEFEPPSSSFLTISDVCYIKGPLH